MIPCSGRAGWRDGALLPILGMSDYLYLASGGPSPSTTFFNAKDLCEQPTIEDPTTDSRRNSRYGRSCGTDPRAPMAWQEPATTAAPEHGTVDDGAGSFYLEATPVQRTHPGRDRGRDQERAPDPREARGRAAPHDGVLQQPRLRGARIRDGAWDSSQVQIRGQAQEEPTPNDPRRTTRHGGLGCSRQPAYASGRYSHTGSTTKYSRNGASRRSHFFGCATVAKCPDWNQLKRDRPMRASKTGLSDTVLSRGRCGPPEITTGRTTDASLQQRRSALGGSRLKRFVRYESSTVTWGWRLSGGDPENVSPGRDNRHPYRPSTRLRCVDTRPV